MAGLRDTAVADHSIWKQCMLEASRLLQTDGVHGAFHICAWGLDDSNEREEKGVGGRCWGKLKAQDSFFSFPLSFMQEAAWVFFK